ncbi:Cytochrome P450 4V2 [Halocaridina rubra]|uniref:Cytochrome P450 4V2 n=1 Tax=Halocaridina rubra TaxID=373956 RepID=A0AAN8XC51_HALRR
MILLLEGDKWRSRRKLLTPAFHFKILDDFLEVFNKHSQKLARRLQAKADGEPFDIVQDITLCALDAICETAMGRSLNAMDDSNSEYVKAVTRIGYLVQQRMNIPWYQPNILYRLIGPAKEHDQCLKILHDFTNDVIKSRRKAFQEKKKQGRADNETNSSGQKKKLAFLDILLEYSENGANLSDRDLQEEVDTFMFEGHDTTSVAAAWILHLIGSHPDIQEKIFEEQRSVFLDKGQFVTMEDLRQLKYLENCIKEGLRLFPSVPIIARELKEDVIINNYTIPAGTNVDIITYRLHRDPEQFPNPEIFDPDRFLPENCKYRHPYAYVPFSAGPRNCIGQKFAMMEAKTLMSTLLRHYRIESVTKREDLKVTADLILRSEDGIIVRLFPRKDTLP